MTLSLVDKACLHYDKARKMRRKLSRIFGRDIMDVHHDCFVIPSGVRLRECGGLMRQISYHERKAEEYVGRKMGLPMKKVVLAEIEDITWIT